MLKNNKLIYIFCLTSGLLFYLPLLSSDMSFLWNLTKEDGFFENAGAFFFLSSSCIFFIIYACSRIGNNFYFFRTNKNIFFFFLALLFFMGFGEEISWGQRFFGIDTPEHIKKLNMQGEINLHNLKFFHRFADLAQTQEKPFWALMLDIGRLYAIFWFTFCIVIPLLTKTSSNMAKFFREINVPIVPLWIGIFFLINYILSNIIYSNVNINKYTSLMEIKECVSAFIFLIVSSYFWSNRKNY